MCLDNGERNITKKDNEGRERPTSPNPGAKFMGLFFPTKQKFHKIFKKKKIENEKKEKLWSYGRVKPSMDVGPIHQL